MAPVGRRRRETGSHASPAEHDAPGPAAAPSGDEHRTSAGERTDAHAERATHDQAGDDEPRSRGHPVGALGRAAPAAPAPPASQPDAPRSDHATRALLPPRPARPGARRVYPRHAARPTPAPTSAERPPRRAQPPLPATHAPANPQPPAGRLRRQQRPVRPPTDPHPPETSPLVKVTHSAAYLRRRSGWTEPANDRETETARRKGRAATGNGGLPRAPRQRRHEPEERWWDVAHPSSNAPRTDPPTTPAAPARRCARTASGSDNVRQRQTRPNSHNPRTGGGNLRGSHAPAR